MERVEGDAFRNGLCKTEMVPKKSNQHLFSDDFWSVNCQNGDDFSVDDLLDFSKHDIIEQFPEEKQEILQIENPSENEQPLEKKAMARTGLTVSCEEFHVPAGDLDDLEWLSNFVDDSFAGYSLTYPTGKLPEKPKPETQQPPVSDVKPSFTSLVQTKARSKRVRTEGRVWSIGSGSLPESSSSSSSSTTSFPPFSNPQSQISDSLILLPPPVKKQRRKKKADNPTPVLSGFLPAVRRCSHCLVQKTPQWRAGPLGAKTLCNACGVRYKSGRLLPEYRPACSPTFSTELHSNNHRKVLEMRQKKAVEADIAPPPVPSF